MLVSCRHSSRRPSSLRAVRTSRFATSPRARTGRYAARGLARGRSFRRERPAVPRVHGRRIVRRQRSPPGGSPGDANDPPSAHPPTPAASSVENAASDVRVGRDAATATDDKDIAFPRWVLCRKTPAPRPRVNHNVFLSLLLAIIYGLADSLWTGTVIAAYLKRLGREKNGPVGNVEAVSGLASLFSALPVGYLADTCGRDKVIGAGGVLIIVTDVAHALLLGWIGTDEEALSHDDHKRELSFILFAVVMAPLDGIFMTLGTI